MTTAAPLYEGKSKRVFATDDPDAFDVYFKDDATAFNGAKKGVIEGKGVINCAVSTALFAWLETQGVPTHHIERTGDRVWRVRRVEIVPVEVVVRNIVAGSLAKRTGLEEGTVLARPVVELYYKSDALNDPMVNEDHALAFGWATADELAAMRAAALKVNGLLVPFFAGIGVKLVDYKLEFGRSLDSRRPGLLLADEITPDGCRLWDAATNEKLDKDRFRRDLGRVEETYREIGDRILQGLTRAA